MLLETFSDRNAVAHARSSDARERDEMSRPAAFIQAAANPFSDLRCFARSGWLAAIGLVGVGTLQRCTTPLYKKQKKNKRKKTEASDYTVTSNITAFKNNCVGAVSTH